jgi:hypothetical protein
MDDPQAIILEKWLQAKDTPVWQELIPFVTAQLLLKQFSPVLKQALQLGADAVELAAKCLKEYRNAARLDPQLEQEIAALRGLVGQSRYAKLEELLKAKEWKMANKETNRVMLQVQEKYSSDYFTSNDLREFPYDDLLTIDRLWVEISNGHFGFSVQIKRWEECGAPNANGKSYDNYKIFMEKVGWQTKGQFIYFNDLKFSQVDSPAGELPWVEGGKSGVGLGSVPYLAERLGNGRIRQLIPPDAPCDPSL